MALQNPGASHLRVVVIAHCRWRMIERRHQVLPDIAYLRVLLIKAQKDVLDILKSGVINDEVSRILEETAHQVSGAYKAG